MQVGTLRIRLDRKSGQELDRKTIEVFEITVDSYEEKLVIGFTGMGSASAAKEIVARIEETKSIKNSYEESREVEFYAINSRLQVQNI